MHHQNVNNHQVKEIKKPRKKEVFFKVVLQQHIKERKRTPKENRQENDKIFFLKVFF